jgi:hypothetical protein
MVTKEWIPFDPSSRGYNMASFQENTTRNEALTKDWIKRHYEHKKDSRGGRRIGGTL